MDVQGKVIVITGAAQGLGRKMAEILAGQGADLALVDLDHAKLRETVRLCSRGKVKNFPADVTDEPAVETLFRRIHADFDGIDGLINNAGVISDALLVKAANGKVQRKMSMARSQAADYALFQARQDHGCLRHVRSGGQDKRTQGCHRGLSAAKVNRLRPHQQRRLSHSGLEFTSF